MAGDRRGLLTVALGLFVAACVAVAVVSADLRGTGIAVTSVEHGDVGIAVFLAAAIAAYTAYAVAVALLGAVNAPLVAVCAVALVVQLLPLGGPLLLSRDAYSYWSYGRIAAAHDANPYVVPPAAFPEDPASRDVARGWLDAPTVYGPAFTAASTAIANVSGRSAADATGVYRVIAAGGMLVLTALAAALARRRSLAAAVVGWNPVLALHAAGGGHNDVWMMAFVLGALFLAERGRSALAGAAWAIAVFIKWVALGLVPLVLLSSRERRRTLALGFLAAAVPLAIISSLAYGDSWVGAFAPVLARRSTFSMPSRLMQLGLPHSVAVGLVTAGAVAGFVLLCRAAMHGRVRLAAAALVFLVATPWLLPWYAAWAVPLAAADEDAAARWAAIALCAYLLPDRIPL